MGIGPGFNIEIQCDEEYAKNWIPKVKDELEASGIIVTPGEMEGVISIYTGPGSPPKKGNVRRANRTRTVCLQLLLGM